MAADGRSTKQDQTDRVADALLALETAPILRFSVTPMAPIGPDGVQAVVSCRIGDATHSLSPADARLLARCLTWEDAGRASGFLAALFDNAACDAEALQLRLSAASTTIRTARGAAA